jgi:hypothetical protein
VSAALFLGEKDFAERRNAERRASLNTTTIVDHQFHDQYIEPVFNVKLGWDMESLGLSSDGRAFLNASVS